MKFPNQYLCSVSTVDASGIDAAVNAEIAGATYLSLTSFVNGTPRSYSQRLPSAIWLFKPLHTD
jgi:hypothetical protein